MTAGTGPMRESAVSEILHHFNKVGYRVYWVALAAQREKKNETTSKPGKNN